MHPITWHSEACVWLQTPAILPPDKCFYYPLNRRLGGTQRWSGHFREENIVYFLLGNSPVSEFYMLTFWNSLSHLHRHVGILHTHPPMRMEWTECSETLAYKIQTPENYPEESVQHSEHSEILKSRRISYVFFWVIPRCLNFICQHFGTHYPIFIGM
jgi:hypothetical protein